MPHDQNYWTTQLVAVGSILGALAGIIPTVAAIVALAWYLLLIYESDTAKKWRGNRAKRHIAKLEAKRLKLLDAIEAAQHLTEPPPYSDDPGEGPNTR